MSKIYCLFHLGRANCKYIFIREYFPYLIQWLFEVWFCNMCPIELANTGPNCTKEKNQIKLKTNTTYSVMKHNFTIFTRLAVHPIFRIIITIQNLNQATFNSYDSQRYVVFFCLASIEYDWLNDKYETSIIWNKIHFQPHIKHTSFELRSYVVYAEWCVGHH